MNETQTQPAVESGADSRDSSGSPRTGRARILSLQSKATTLIVALVLAMTGVVTGYLMRISERMVREQQRDHLLQTASLLAESAAVMLENGDRAGLETLVRDAARGTSLVAVSVLGARGELLAEATREDGAEALEGESAVEPIRIANVPGSELHDVHLPVGIDGSVDSLLTATHPIKRRDGANERHLGYVRTAMAVSPLRMVVSKRFDMMVAAVLLAAVATVPFGFVLVRRIVAPMESLAGSMNAFARGRLDVRSAIDRSDEIGDLARAFNQMADRHERTQARLLRLNAELEDRVAFRTRQLRDLAARDPLTGLYNRRHFAEALELRFAEAVRYGNELTCVMIDLDEFKAANDRFGHQTGDELLLLTATTIVSQLRSADIVSRYGGDEFIMLLPQTDNEQAKVLAERIMRKFSRDADERYGGVGVHMSIGVSSLLATGVRTAADLIRAADRALYAAKSAGKNRIVAAMPLEAESALPG